MGERMARTALVLAISIVVSAVPQLASAATTVVKDVTYRDVAGVNLTLDVYMPGGAGPYPAIVFIHGGMFYTGDKCQRKFVARSKNFASAGYVVYNINYRLAPRGGNSPTVLNCADGSTTDISYLQGNHYPAAHNDATAAVNWVRANASSYKSDASRTSCVGSSAGGTLCYWLGAKALVDVQAGWSGPVRMDVTKTSIHENYMGCSLSVCRDDWRAGSAYYNVDSNSQPAAIYNSSNETIPRSDADAYADALSAAGVENQKTILEGTKHADAYAADVLPNGKTVWRDTADFIAAHH